jgi:tRNA-modifying protein YgfZ
MEMPQIASQNSFYFEKGCHVGQEVVSRMKHRGGARKRVVRVRLDGAVPARGTPVMDGELPVGTLGASAGERARGWTG